MVISSFLSNRWLWVVLNRKCSQEYPVNAGVSQGSILAPSFFYYKLMTFLVMLSAILLSVQYNDTTLYSKYDQASDLWQQPELASELKSDL